MEFLEFMFQDFWHFTGIIILAFVVIVIPVICISDAISSDRCINCKNYKKEE